MAYLTKKSSVEVQNVRKRKGRRAVTQIVAVTMAAAASLLAILGAALNATGREDDKYSLRSPDGIAFSEFRGYEDWAVASSARTEEVQKVIVANSVMIQAFRAGTQRTDRTFPEGSKIVKLQWSQKKSTEATFPVDVPDVFKQAFVMEKDSKKFPNTGGWGYAVFNYDAASHKFTADPTAHADCGNTCHMAMKAKDYIFHSYEIR